MATNNRICLCCLKKFTFCPNCGNNNGYDVNFDTEECAKLFNAISSYNMGVAGKDRIKNVVDEFGITDYTKYKDSIAKFLRTEIFNGNYEAPVSGSMVTEINEKESEVANEENEPEVQTKSHKRRFSSKNKSYQKKEVELSDETGENEVETTGISEEE